jgi:long-chain acyl-CoA synthetase
VIATEPEAEPSRSPLTLQTARTLVDLLLVRGGEPYRVAARYKAGGQWREATWGEMLRRICRVGEGLKAIGIKPGDRVAIFASSRYEWALANFGIYAAGAAVVPIYGSYTPAEVAHILRDSGAKAAFCDHDEPDKKQVGRLSRLKDARKSAPKLEHIIGFDIPTIEGQQLSLASLEELGAKASPKMLEERAALTKPDDLAYLIYTSGTTGAPKGVMLTHSNWASQARGVVEIQLITRDDTALILLPLAHAFALVIFAAWLGEGMVVAFAESIERAVDNAGETRSTVMPVVPRVLEKAYNKVIADASSQPGIKGQLFAWAMRQFDAYAAARAEGREYSSLQWAAARRLVFSKIEARLKARFGGYMREFVSGGAPLARKIGYFFDVCGFHVCEGFGLTETSAPTHVNLPFPGKTRIGTVGLPFPGVEVRIADDGEILLRGPQIMKGYFNMPQETAAVLEPEGWLHTGDIGEVDPEGFLRITDRKKDLIKTSGGKFIAPQELESGLRHEPLIGQVFIVGDKRKYVSALFTVSEDSARDFAKQKGLSFGSYAELSQLPEIRARVQAAVDGLNARLPSYATIKKFAILDHDWSQDSGELTPTLKVKRKVVGTRYKAIIDSFYEGEVFE